MKFLILLNNLTENSRTAHNGLIDIYTAINDATPKVPQRFDFVHSPVVDDSLLRVSEEDFKLDTKSLHNTVVTGDYKCFIDVPKDLLDKIDKINILLYGKKHNNLNAFGPKVSNEKRKDLSDFLYKGASENISNSSASIKGEILQKNVTEFAKENILPIIEVNKEDYEALLNLIKTRLIPYNILGIFDDVGFRGPSNKLFPRLGIFCGDSALCREWYTVTSMVSTSEATVKQQLHLIERLTSRTIEYLKKKFSKEQADIAIEMLNYMTDINNFIEVVDITTAKPANSVISDLKTLLSLEPRFTCSSPLELELYNLPKIKEFVTKLSKEDSEIKTYLDTLFSNYSEIELLNLLSKTLNKKDKVVKEEKEVIKPTENITDAERSVMQSSGLYDQMRNSSINSGELSLDALESYVNELSTNAMTNLAASVSRAMNGNYGSTTNIIFREAA